MSYNGIGLQTPRGTGTNGHISRNLSSLKSREPYSASAAKSEPQLESRRRADIGILEHEAKRQIQNRLLIYRTTLEDADPPLTESEVEARISQYRVQVEAEAKQNLSSERQVYKAYQTHDIVVSKGKEMSKFRSAIGVREDYEEGQAMNKAEDNKKESLPYDPNMERPRNPLDRRSGKRHEHDSARRHETRQRSPKGEVWRHERSDFRRNRSRQRTRSASRPRHQSRGRSRSRSRTRYRDRRRRRSVSSESHTSVRSIQGRRVSSRSRSERRTRRTRVRSSRRHDNVSRGREARRYSPDPSETLAGREAETRRGRSRTRDSSQVSPIEKSHTVHTDTAAAMFDRRKALGIDP